MNNEWTLQQMGEFVEQQLRSNYRYSPAYARRETQPLKLNHLVAYYLAGPISAPTEEQREKNKQLFRDVAAHYRSIGSSIVNPVEIEENKGLDWSGCMRNDITQLVRCTGIMMLPGWRQSRGAMLEHQIAVSLGMDVLYLSDKIGEMLSWVLCQRD